MAINKTWDDVEEREEIAKLPVTKQGFPVVAHLIGWVFRDNVPDPTTWKNYKPGDTHDDVTPVYAIVDDENNFPQAEYEVKEGEPRTPTGDTHVFKNFAETLNYSGKSNHLKTLKMLKQDATLSEEVLREQDFAKVYTDLIGMPVFAELIENKVGDKTYLNIANLTQGVRLKRKEYTESINVPKFLLEDKDGKVLHNGTITIADVLEG